MSALQRVHDALEARGCRREGDRWQCPAHEDRKPSLSVTRSEGKVLLKCHAGCNTADVLAALWLEARDLFDEAAEGAKTVEATYDYVDVAGELLFQVVRFVPKDFRQRRPDGAGGWIWKLEGTRRVLYRLPAVLAARDVSPIYVVEGEKDVHALEKVGAVATCNPQGAGKWREEYAEVLRGATVAVVADRDDAGRTHAESVRRSLEGVAKSVHVVEPAEGKDAHDHLSAGRGLHEFVEVEAPGSQGQGGDDPDRTPALRVVPAAAFAAVVEASAKPLLGTAEEAVLPAGGGLVFYGRGGAGKTTAEVDLVFHLAAGVDWLGIPVPGRCRVLVIENEGPRGMFRRKLRAKLAAWGGPSVDGHLFVLDEPWAQFTFDSEPLRRQLVEAVREHEVDVVAAGPVHRLGIKGGGTPEEVAAFAGLIEQVRAELERPLAYTLAHHDNKAGTVSGAWEGVPDTLCHVRNTGNGATRLEWDKCRWSGELHGTAWTLLWREGESFERDERPEVTDEDIRAAVLAAVEAQPGCSARGLEKSVGHHHDRVRSIRDELLEAGELVDGPPPSGRRGRGMALYLPGDANCAQTLGTVMGEVRPHPGEGKLRPAPTRKEVGAVGAVRRGRNGPVERCSRCELPLTRGEPGEPFCQCSDGGSDA